MPGSPRVSLFTLALALAACGGDPTSSASDTADSTSASTDGDGTSSGGAAGVVDLAACALPRDCAALCEHIGVTDCDGQDGDGPRCAAKLLVAGAPGVLEHYLLYYGQPEAQTIYVMRGDGVAVLQTRTRDAADLPWGEPGALMRCDVTLPPELAPACEADDVACQWRRSFYADCAEATIAGCDEVEAWIAAAAP
ncbi:MAG: hypothetical protein R3A79_30310 [Nannocystaceae bacterium]